MVLPVFIAGLLTLLLVALLAKVQECDATEFQQAIIGRLHKSKKTKLYYKHVTHP